jgi:hypothetical protein
LGVDGLSSLGDPPDYGALAAEAAPLGIVAVSVLLVLPEVELGVVEEPLVELLVSLLLEPVLLVGAVVLVPVVLPLVVSFGWRLQADTIRAALAAATRAARRKGEVGVMKALLAVEDSPTLSSRRAQLGDRPFPPTSRPVFPEGGTRM